MGKTLEMPISLLRTMAFNFNILSENISAIKLREDLAKYRSGFKGEISINYFLYTIINKNYKVFHNARLHSKGQNFEIDTLLITDRFLLILEVKNLSGSISFDHGFGGMFQTNYGKTKLYQDPILQVERQKKLLHSWLNERGVQMPIETLVCFVNRNAILERVQSKVDPRIIYGYKLNQKYEEFVEMYQNHKVNVSTEDLINELFQESDPLDVSLLDKYGLTKEDFVPGCICLKCDKKSMRRIDNTWMCEVCKTEDPEAPIHALKDYFLIFGPRITNEEARHWLQVDDRNYVKYLLNKVCKRKEGKGRNLVYILDFDYQNDFNHLVEYYQKHY